MGSVLRWVFYGVFLSILPLWVTWLFVPKAVSLDELLGRGELAVLAITLASTSMAAVWEGRKSRRLSEWLVGSNVVLPVLATLLLIAVVVKAENVTAHAAVVFSAWILVVTALVGLVCNWRPNRSEEDGK